MDALQPPHPLDKKTTASDMAHISCLPHKDAAAAAAAPACFSLLLLFVLFITVLLISFCIKEPFVPFQCCGHKSYRDLFDSPSSDPRSRLPPLSLTSPSPPI